MTTAPREEQRRAAAPPAGAHAQAVARTHAGPPPPGSAPTPDPDPAALGRGQPSATALGDAIRIAAGLSFAAGIIHAIAMVDHFSHYWLYGVFFLVLTYGQVLWGAALWRGRASARALAIGAYANLAIVGVWLLSRTIGIPVGPYDGNPEPIGLPDAAATIDQLLLVAYVGVILRPPLRVARGLRVLLGPHRIRLGMMICSASAFAGMLGGHNH